MGEAGASAKNAARSAPREESVDPRFQTPAFVSRLAAAQKRRAALAEDGKEAVESRLKFKQKPWETPEYLAAERAAGAGERGRGGHYPAARALALRLAGPFAGFCAGLPLLASMKFSTSGRMLSRQDLPAKIP